MPDDYRVWGDDRARPRLYHAALCLGRDPDAVFVVGERDGSVQLEAWHADTGVRVGAWAVARGARLLPGELARGEHDDEALLAVHGVARTEALAVDLETGSTRRRLILPRDVTRVSSLRRDGSAALVEREDGRTSLVTRSGAQAVCAGPAAVAHASLLVACNAPDGAGLRLLTAGGEELTLTGLPPDVRASRLAFAPGDSTLWAAGEAEVACWDVATRVLLGRWSGVPDGPFLAFSPDGLRALLDGPLALAVGHERPAEPRASPWDAVHARTSPDGRRLASPSAVLSWHDLDRDRRVELAGVGHAGSIRDLAASPDGARVASCAADGTIRVWEAAEGACEWVFEGSPGGYDAVAFASDGRTLYAVAATPRRLTAWSLADGVEVTPRELPFPGAGLAVSPDGRTLVARELTRRHAADGCVVDLARFAPAAPWLPRALADGRVDPRAGVSLALSRDGAGLEVFGRAPTFVAYSFELASGERVDETLDPFFSDLPRALAFSRDGRWFADLRDVEGRAIDVTIRDVRNGYRAAARRQLFGRWAAGGAFAVGDGRAAVGEADGWVTVIDRGGEGRGLSPQLRSQTTAAAFSPDEKALYVGTHHGQVAVFRL